MESGVLKEKVGPLPLWGWLVALTVLAVAYYWRKSRQANSTALSSSSTTAQGQVPEFVIQNQFPVSVSGNGSSSGGQPSGCSPPDPTAGYSSVTVAEATADRKLGAKVMALATNPGTGCSFLLPWNGKAGDLYISTSWLSQHKKRASGTSSHTATSTAPPPATKSPARATAAPTGVTTPPEQTSTTSTPAKVPAKGPGPQTKAPRRTPVRSS